MILTCFTLLMPAFSLLFAPAVLTVDLQRKQNAPLLLVQPMAGQTHGFGAELSPVTLSAQDHLTSELLRTLSRMAASKPTSWLFLQSHFVYHLVQNLGP